MYIETFIGRENTRPNAHASWQFSDTKCWLCRVAFRDDVLLSSFYPAKNSLYLRAFCFGSLPTNVIWTCLNQTEPNNTLLFPAGGTSTEEEIQSWNKKRIERPQRSIFCFLFAEAFDFWMNEWMCGVSRNFIFPKMTPAIWFLLPPSVLLMVTSSGQIRSPQENGFLCTRFQRLHVALVQQLPTGRPFRATDYHFVLRKRRTHQLNVST